MTSTLVFRLVGPMQSWGTQSRFSERDTGMEPSKSGVIGILCAALGRPRDQSIEDLTMLKMGVRVDREGILKRDFQTALDVIKADQKSKDTVISSRYYLADARFLVGLEGSQDLLANLDRALSRPVWSTFLGRKSYLPSASIHMPRRPNGFTGLADAPGVIELPLRETLSQYPFLCQIPKGTMQLRLVLDGDASGPVRSDVPISFSTRTFATRHVDIEWLQVADHSGQIYSENEPNHTQEDSTCTSPA